ncbi:MAG: hypothetical protein VKN33_10890 [Candidatus Sericytochromatia bacterium]|nr:hypothetical protein [Candidatus Sericytochromatia bacterium]
MHDDALSSYESPLEPQSGAQQDDPEPAVIWLESAEKIQPEPERRGLEADPEHVIHFLLKKIDESQAKLSEQDAYADLLQQELEQVRGQLQVAREELDRQLADYEVVMQNALSTEQELETYKRKAQTKQTIQLPFYAEEKLAKLGYDNAGMIQAIR